MLMMVMTKKRSKYGFMDMSVLSASADASSTELLSLRRGCCVLKSGSSEKKPKESLARDLQMLETGVLHADDGDDEEEV